MAVCFHREGEKKKLWQIFLLNTDLIMSHWSVLYPQVEVEEVEVQVVQMWYHTTAAARPTPVYPSLPLTRQLRNRRAANFEVPPN